MFDFPSSPSLNQTVTATNGIIYIWDGTKWVSSTAGNPFPVAPTPSYGNNTTSVATTAFVQTAVAPAFNDVGRNCIHNSMFNIAQRGAGPFTANAVYTLDRWQVYLSSDTVSVTQQAMSDADRSQIGDEAARYALQNVFTGNAGAAAANILYQKVESVRRFGGKTVTVSFWAVASTGTPKLGISIDQLFGNGGSPSASALGNGVAVTISTTWTRYSTTLAVASSLGATLGTNGDDSTALNFWFSAGSSFATRSGSIGVQSATVKLWGVQCEVVQAGQTLPTILEKPDPQQDLAKCQRFYQTTHIDWNQSPVTAGVVSDNRTLMVLMRAAPTVTYSNIAYGPGTSALTNYGSTTSMFKNGVSMTAGAGGWVTADVTLSADL